MGILDFLFDSGGESNKARMRREAAERQAEKKRIQKLTSGGINQANDYFSNLSVDPSQYDSQIKNAVKSAVAGGATDVSGIGRNLYDQLGNARSTRTLREFDEFAPADFERSRIQDTADDEIIAGLLEGGRGSADQYVNNLLNRGVITESGAGAARSDLDRQAPGIQSLLTDLGNTFIAGGRGNLSDIANRGRLAASNLELGSPEFDVSRYSGDIDAAFDEFMGSLGGKFAAQAPKSLFETTGLANVAGAAQGAGNRPFDPKAVSGAFLGGPEEDEDENRTSPLTIF